MPLVASSTLSPGRVAPVLKLVCEPPGGRLLAAPYRWVMPWFDLFMMRKQFRNLKRLAEKTAAAGVQASGSDRESVGASS